MKHVFNLFPKLAAIAAVALSISSCNRAEYAMLPKTASAYHGTQRGVIVQPAPAPAVVSATPEATEPVATEAVAPAVVAPQVAKSASAERSAVAEVVATKPAASTKAPKMSLVQKALVQKVAKKADKLAGKVQIKKRTEAASTSRLEGKLRQGLILVLVGLLVELLGAAVSSSLIYVLGAILILVGLVLIVLWLLDEL